MVGGYELCCVGMDEAGKGMNVAFAIGRPSNLDDGRKRFLHHKDANDIVRRRPG